MDKKTVVGMEKLVVILDCPLQKIARSLIQRGSIFGVLFV